MLPRASLSLQELTGASRNRYIPYMVIRAITLIAVLRLGLVDELKEHAYHDFVKLPLYEDMAPWNIVFQGPTLDYIDYDTKDKTFSKVMLYAKVANASCMPTLAVFVQPADNTHTALRLRFSAAGRAACVPGDVRAHEL